MTQLQRPPTGLSRSFICLLLTLSLTINTFRLSQAVDLISSASGYTCLPECGPGFECKLGLCKRKQCNQDCKDVPKQLLCAENGVTYNNTCELEKVKCELAQEIDIIYNGTCITYTLPPPPEKTCNDHRKDWDEMTELNLSKFLEKCDLEEVERKNTAGTLEYNDIVHCYRPHCDPDNNLLYTTKQCSYLHPEWCWCSSPDGHGISDTFQRNMPDNFCSNRPQCNVDGEIKLDGQVYTVDDVCGVCECINGTHTCFVNHTVDDDGRLSNGSLENLKKQLIQVFNFQFNHKKHFKVDIRYIYKYPTHVSESQKETILGWKFNHYDKNDDDVLSNVEEFIYHTEVAGLFGCRKFVDHLTELTDTNKNSELTLQEWNDFFELDTSGQSSSRLGKREAVRRKPLHLRKKFHYVLQ